jgi:hypothetical protein
MEGVSNIVQDTLNLATSFEYCRLETCTEKAPLTGAMAKHTQEVGWLDVRVDTEPRSRPMEINTLEYETLLFFTGGCCIFAYFLQDWENDQANGHGVKTFANGDTHEGQYKADRRKGLGVYRWKNGDVYTGMWDDGKMHGIGKKTMVNGDIYEGVTPYNYKDHIRIVVARCFCAM